MEIQDDFMVATPPKLGGGNLQEKIDYSIAMLRRAEPLALKYDPDNGFALAFSGGKDSQALYHIAVLAGVKFKAFFSPTSVDPPEVIRFIREYYPDVQFDKLHTTIYKEAIRQRMLPTRKCRWCCAVFKEVKGAGKVTLTGVRRAESTKRSTRGEYSVSGHKFNGSADMFEQFQAQQNAKQLKHLNRDQFAEAKASEVRCISGKDKIVINPILYLTEQDVWNFLNNVVKVPHCKLYDEGFHRIGCICCPMSTLTHKERGLKRWPHVKKKWLETIKQMGVWQNFQTLPDVTNADELAERVFDWWINGESFETWYNKRYSQRSFNFGD